MKKEITLENILFGETDAFLDIPNLNKISQDDLNKDGFELTDGTVIRSVVQRDKPISYTVTDKNGNVLPTFKISTTIYPTPGKLPQTQPVKPQRCFVVVCDGNGAHCVPLFEIDCKTGEPI